MKNVFKMLGIIFLTTVLCFAQVSCDEDESIGSKVTVPGSTLARKIEWVKSHRASGTTYTIEVTADEEISGYELTSGSNKNMTIILNGNGKTISLKNDVEKWLFMVGDNITLELNNITLKGHDYNRASLVMVIGTLVMNDGTKIIGNKMVVKITNKIGYKVETKDAVIGYGGGVWVKPHGVFRITNGIIYGKNETDVSLRNNAESGAALSFHFEDSTTVLGTAQYGTFNGDTWISNGNLYATDNTIRVVNGVLQ